MSTLKLDVVKHGIIGSHRADREKCSLLRRATRCEYLFNMQSHPFAWAKLASRAWEDGPPLSSDPVPLLGLGEETGFASKRPE